MKKIMAAIIMVVILCGTVPAFAATSSKAPTAKGYTIYVNREKCHVDIYKNGVWFKGFICDVGKASTPTPKGVFYTGASGFSFGDSTHLCKYATVISGNYCFHTWLYDSKGKTVIDGRLGLPISHGCVRLHPDNAKWICNNIPRGTKVVIN